MALPPTTSQQNQQSYLEQSQEHAPICLHGLTNLKDVSIHSCMVVTAPRTDVERGGVCRPVRLDSEESLQVFPTSIKTCQLVELWEHYERTRLVAPEEET